MDPGTREGGGGWNVRAGHLCFDCTFRLCAVLAPQFPAMSVMFLVGRAMPD